MTHVSKAIRIAVAGGILAGGLMAVGSGSADAAPTQVGTCTGFTAIAKVAGFTNANAVASMSAKGIAPGGSRPTQGSCSVTQSGATTLTGAITKWSAKLSSPATDCISDTDNAEYPLNGKLSIAAGTGKFDAYVQFTGINTNNNGADTATLKGIVTKGIGAGLFVDGEIFFDPIVKDKTVTNAYPGTILGVGPLPGYAYDLPNALGCQDNTGATPANITGLIVGDGNSPLLGSSAAGLTFSKGV